MTRQLPPKCDFYGCNRSVCANDMKLKTGKRFCQQHSDEFTQLVKGDNTAGLVAFMANSYGPVDMLARNGR